MFVPDVSSMGFCLYGVCDITSQMTSHYHHVTPLGKTAGASTNFFFSQTLACTVKTTM